MKQTRNILIALLFGLIVGLLFNVYGSSIFENVNKYVFSPMGQLFIRMIKMIVVPIVFCSIVLGVAGIADPKKLGRIGVKTISYFLVTTALAITIAVTLASFIEPGKGQNFETDNLTYTAKAKEGTFVDTLLQIIPENPIASASNGDMLQIIAFAVFVGMGISALGSKVEGVKKLIEQGNDIMMYLVGIVMKFAPFGAFGLLASSVGQMGFGAVVIMGKYMGVVVLGLFLHYILVYGLSLKLLAKESPITFFKNFYPVMAIGFSTSSSNATLPFAMETVQKKMGVPKAISSFVQPLGATINMDGTAIMQGAATVFIAQVYGIDLTLSQLAIVVLTAVLASIGTAGVPGVGLVMLTMVLNQVGLPVEGIALIIGVDRILDMLRTCVNVAGDATCAVIVAKSEAKHEEKVQTA